MTLQGECQQRLPISPSPPSTMVLVEWRCLSCLQLQKWYPLLGYHRSIFKYATWTVCFILSPTNDCSSLSVMVGGRVLPPARWCSYVHCLSPTQPQVSQISYYESNSKTRPFLIILCAVGNLHIDMFLRSYVLVRLFSHNFFTEYHLFNKVPPLRYWIVQFNTKLCPPILKKLISFLLCWRPVLEPVPIVGSLDGSIFMSLLFHSIR